MTLFTFEDLDNTANERIKIFDTQKLTDGKSNQQKVSNWTDSYDSSAFLCYVFTNKRFHKITNKCHVGTEARGCLAQT